jgi:toxin ParE1/3/4
MALKVRFSKDAIRDLDSIHEYLAARSPQGASRVSGDILAVIDRLAELPLTGRPTQNPRVRVAQLRRYPYRLFYSYSANDDTLVVLHIRHAARAPIDPTTL